MYTVGTYTHTHTRIYVPEMKTRKRNINKKKRRTDLSKLAGTRKEKFTWHDSHYRGWTGSHLQMYGIIQT